MTNFDQTARRAATTWAAVLDVPAAWLTEPGVHVHARNDDRDHVSFLSIQGTVVSVPGDLVDELADEGDEIARFDALVDILGDRAGSVVGPARMGWLPDGWMPAASARTREVVTMEPTDRRLGAFHTRLPPTDQEQWRVRASHAHALVRGGRVIAAALTSVVGGSFAHLGVATATDHRLQGHATAVTARASEDAMSQDLVPQFRAAERNRGSWQTAAGVGFVAHARQGIVRLTR